MGSETARVRTILHVLPHPGGGGATYVEALSRMDGYRFEQVFLRPGQEPGARLLVALRAVPE